ncbi:MAG: hypothetical protein ACRCVT_01785 [Leadbetterella sp.]
MSKYIIIPLMCLVYSHYGYCQMGDKLKVESTNADELAVSDKIQSLNREAIINNQKIPYKVTCGKIP